MFRLFAFILSISLTGAACEIREDTSVLTASQAGQLTLIFSGGGDGPRRGGLFVEASEGADPKKMPITVLMPGLNCKREACADFEVIRKDGSVFPLGAIPKGKTSLSFSLADLTGEEHAISRPRGGPYRVRVVAYYDHDGEHKVDGSGIVYVVVLSRGYVGLSCGGADVAWSVKVRKDCEAHFTTKMRTALCGRGCE